jgi:PKD repeat protein
MMAWQFESQSTITQGTARSTTWQFGDGQTSTDLNPIHVYLAPGTYECKLEVVASNGIKDSFAVKLDVQPSQDDLDFSLARMDKFWEWTKGADAEKLPTAHLVAFREFLAEMDKPERPKKVFEVCAALDKRRGEMTTEQIHDVAMDLGKYYLKPLGDAKMAEKYFDLALEKCKETDLARQFDARFNLAELYLDYERNLDKAQRTYEELRRDFPATDPERGRLALIRLGDIERDRHNLDKAHEMYEEAQYDTSYGPKEQPMLIEGRYTHDIETFLREKDTPGEPPNAERALQTIDEWLRACPLKRLEGYPAAMALEAHMRLKDYQDVKKVADVYLSWSNDPDWVPKVHVLDAEACIELGLFDEARKHYRTVLDDWKESPYLKDATDGLQRIQKMGH